MVERRLGRATSRIAVMLASLALVAPGAASAADQEVLVVASKSDALSKAGVDAIRSAGKSAGFSVTAPSPADIGDQFAVLVLRPVAGGPGNNFFNLNWVEFVGGGVGTPYRQPLSREPARLPGRPVRGGEESS